MFEWKVEDMKLMNENLLSRTYFPCERTTSREDKIEFVDSLQDGKLSYILKLIDKFNEDSKSMPKDNWGNVKTVSLKAWIKKNDTEYGKPIIDDWYHYGKYSLLSSERYIQSDSDSKGSGDIYNDFVDECFHRQLRECQRMEKRWFDEHDEYTILRKSVEKNIEKYGTTFGVSIIISSSNGLLIGDFDNERKPSLEELKALNAKYEQLEKFIENLTKETHIVY